MGFFKWLFGKKSKPTGVLVSFTKPTTKPALNTSRIMPSKPTGVAQAQADVNNQLYLMSIDGFVPVETNEPIRGLKANDIIVDKSNFLGSSEKYQLETKSICEALDISSHSSYSGSDSSDSSSCGGFD